MRRLYGPEALAAHVFEDVNLTMDGINVTLDASEHRRLATSYSRKAEAAYSSCTYASGSACVIVDSCSFAFRGSDDKQDWVSNANGFKTEEVGGKTVHQGFYNELTKLTANTGLNTAVGACANPNFIGHSLGGAMASIAKLEYGKGNVYTYGAPAFVKNNGDNFIGGYRLWHEDDPVPKAAGVLGYGHAGGSHEIYEWRDWKWKGCGWWCRYYGYDVITSVRGESWSKVSSSGFFAQIVSNVVSLISGNSHYHSMQTKYNVYAGQSGSQ